MTNVLVYGTLKRGKSNSQALRTAKFLGVVYTDSIFTLYDAGGFPYALMEGNSTLEVELYEVDDETLKRLDVIEGVAYGHYRRTEVEWTDSLGNNGWAHIYVGTADTADFVREYYVRIPMVEKRGWYVAEWK